MPLSATRTLTTFRYALYFDGVDDYVGNASFPNPDRPFTIAAWFNPVRPPPNYAMGLAGFSFIRGAGDGTTRYLMYNAYAEVIFWGYDADIKDGYGIIASPFVWHYASVSYVDDCNLRLSVDGIFRTSPLKPGCLSTAQGNEYNIGRAYLVWQRWFYGHIAQVLIYSRSLSDSEVKFNYDNPDNPVRNGLILWLKAQPDYIKDIDGDGLLEWVDLSGCNNHGKIYGARLVEIIRTPLRTLATTRALVAVR
jgi:hypothetical protein